MRLVVAFIFLCVAQTAHAGSLMETSWYGGSLAGRKTASGERFNPHGLTAAHRSLPFGTILLLSNPHTGKRVRVRVTDRGPFVRGRQLDVSRATAQALGFISTGRARLWVEKIK